MDALLLPIGHDLGALYGDDGTTRRQQVRAGIDVAELSANEFAVWLLAHGIDDRDRPTRESVLRSADRFGLEAPVVNEIVERLLEDRLLVALDPDAADAVEFAERHQLIPLLAGLGPDAGQPGMCSIGMIGQPVVQVSAPVYDVWTWSHLTPHLWAGCHDAAEVARAAGVTNADETDPRQVLSGMLRSVHGLLCLRAAFVDRRTT
ncbi:hypothetical protein ACIA49_39740 [Kribbella sp. NPDC051587]|uniref:hypothetical protein n=1 Tax=Kribbella sp. NPDC051587 TaxID=3364119 RepID=UPI00378DCA9E